MDTRTPFPCRTAWRLPVGVLALALTCGACAVLDEAERERGSAARAVAAAHPAIPDTAVSDMAATDGPDAATWTALPVPASSIPWQRLVGAARLAGRIGRRPFELDGGGADDETGPAPAATAEASAAGPDPGPERAPFVADLGALARTEAAAVTAGEVPPLEYANVVHGAIVLEAAIATDTTVGDGHRVPLAREPLVRVRQGVRLAEVGSRARGLIGQRVQLYDGAWPVCTARIARLALHVTFHRPWGSTVLGGDPEQDLTAPAAAFARAAWHHDLARPMLVAELDGARGDCTAASWARSLRLPPAATAPVQSAPAAWQRKATSLFRQLPAWRAVQADFRGATLSGRRTPRWDGYGSGIRVTLVRGRGETWVHAVATAGEGCGEFWGSLQALWRVTGDLSHPRRAQFELRGADGAGEELDLIGGADPDGDGSLDLLLRDGRVRERLEAQERVEVPAEWTCPC